MMGDSVLQDRPNLVVMGVAHSYTTPLTRMLGALGWTIVKSDEPGDANAKVAESEECAAIDLRCIEAIRNGSDPVFDHDRAAAFIASLEAWRPWVLKQPRFVLTLALWRRHLPSDTVLVWIYRHPDRVRDHYLAREPDRPVETMIYGLLSPNEAVVSAAMQYEQWGGPRLRITVDQVRAAALVWDEGLFQTPYGGKTC